MKDFNQEEIGKYEILKGFAEVPISFQSYDRAVTEELTNNSPFKNIMSSLVKTNLELSDKLNVMFTGKDYNPIVFDKYEYTLSKDVEFVTTQSIRTLVQRSVINYVFDTLNYLNTISNRKYNLFDIILSNTKDPRFTELYNRIPDVDHIITNILTFGHWNDTNRLPESTPYLFSSLQLDYYKDQFNTSVDIKNMYQDMISHSMYNNVMNVISSLIQISLQNNFSEIRELIYSKYKSNYKNTPNEFMDIQNLIFYSLSSPIRELNFNVELFSGYIIEMISGSFFYSFTDFITINKIEEGK